MSTERLCERLWCVCARMCVCVRVSACACAREGRCVRWRDVIQCGSRLTLERGPWEPNHSKFLSPPLPYYKPPLSHVIVTLVFEPESPLARACGGTVGLPWWRRWWWLRREGRELEYPPSPRPPPPLTFFPVPLPPAPPGQGRGRESRMLLW